MNYEHEQMDMTGVDTVQSPCSGEQLQLGIIIQLQQIAVGEEHYW